MTPNSVSARVVKTSSFSCEPSMPNLTEAPSERPTLERLMHAFEELRPIAMQAVQLAFAHEIELALNEFVEQGGVFDLKNLDDQR